MLADLATDAFVLDQPEQGDDLSAVIGDDPPAGVDGNLDVNWVEIHQATGMIAAQLGIGVDEALVRLRAYAFLRDETLGATGQAIVARELIYGQQGDTTSGG